jgi:hypothetical protein
MDGDLSTNQLIVFDLEYTVGLKGMKLAAVSMMAGCALVVTVTVRLYKKA